MDDLIFDHELYSEYMDDLNNSQGFYVSTSDDGNKLLGGIRRISKNKDHIYRRAEIAAAHAIEQHNNNEKETERNLKMLKIVNLNTQPTAGALYYITLEAMDSSGEINHYQAKICERLHSGYQVQIFRLAPYAAPSSSESMRDGCCRIRVHNLRPGMNENYLFYKCFYRARDEILSVKVILNEETDPPEAYGVVSFKNYAAAEEFLMQYNEKLMPHTNDQYFKLDWETCSTS